MKHIYTIVFYVRENGAKDKRWEVVYVLSKQCRIVCIHFSGSLYLVQSNGSWISQQLSIPPIILVNSFGSSAFFFLHDDSPGV